MFDFSGQVAMISGASGNLGQAVARAFLQAGARVVLVDHAVERLPQLFPELVNSPDHLFCAPTDVTQPSAVQTLVQTVVEKFGRIDVLANTVGGFRAGAPVHKTPIEIWDFMFDINARSAFVLSQGVVPVMLAQDSGNIIHVAARAALGGSADAAAYTASKSAVIRLVESLAAEVKMHGIRVNCVLPGTIDTPGNRRATPDADFSRWVAPEAIADVILFLASPTGRAIQGASIPVYGLS